MLKPGRGSRRLKTNAEYIQSQKDEEKKTPGLTTKSHSTTLKKSPGTGQAGQGQAGSTENTGESANISRGRQLTRDDRDPDVEIEVTPIHSWRTFVPGRGIVRSASVPPSRPPSPPERPVRADYRSSRPPSPESMAGSPPRAFVSGAAGPPRHRRRETIVVEEAVQRSRQDPERESRRQSYDPLRHRRWNRDEYVSYEDARRERGDSRRRSPLL